VINNEANNVCPDCNNWQDKYGDHALTCKVSSGPIDKHNSIINAIFGQMKSANISCSSEEFNPMKDRSRERPGDIYYMADFDIFGQAFCKTLA
jgi:hypothetical protein